MTRDAFRTQTFDRDHHTCVVCGAPGIDAHHIVERRLFQDGGYDLDNGATLCAGCHLDAECTVVSCEEIRERAGITRPVLPPHFYGDQRYDKWGNPILPDGRRLQGELFDDPSVQKVLAPVLHLFDARVKYPRTWHLPWSHPTSDDRTLTSTDPWQGIDVVVTEKMDGENTTLYREYLHARSIDYTPHVSRSYVRNLHATIRADIPPTMRICGENLWATHSIHYDALAAYFQVFSIWDRLTCLDWDATVEWAALFGLVTVPVLYRGSWDALAANGPTAMHFRLMAAAGAPNTGIIGPTPDREVEGYVVRPVGAFSLRQFSTRVGKYVRASHVQTHGHWMRARVEPNALVRSQKGSQPQ